MSLFAIGLIASPITYVCIGLVAVLLFGNRLPSVARSLGSSIVEFKRGTRGITDEIASAQAEITDAVKIPD